MKTKAFLTSFYTVLFCFLLSTSGWTQDQDSKNYELLPYPDIWYNDVDGIRIGANVIGQVPGTFEDGPHRLHAGLWVGTWWPDLPVSYYIDFTEPIPSISGFNSEGNVQFVSSIRTGFSQHGLSFNKRWQEGFDERQFTTLSVGLKAQKRFDEEYLFYPLMWQEDWLWLGSVQFERQGKNTVGLYQLTSSVVGNLAGKRSSFIRSSSEFKQRVMLGKGFGFRGRIFLGLASDETTPEYLFGRSFLSANQWMNNSLARAKGTIPTPWMNSGSFQITGGANLRGYNSQEISDLKNGLSPLITSVTALNVELDYPNPLDKAIKKIPVIGKLLSLRSYLFSDNGTSLGFTAIEEEDLLSDAGAGFMFSLNIPDYLGRPRGIMLRYDIPFWLSHPDNGKHFSYRSVIGIGAIFSL